MKDCRQFYIDGKWVAPEKAHDVDVISPANEEMIATISLGSAGDVDKAVAAAKRSWETFSETTAGERLALLRRIIEVYKARQDEMAETISREMDVQFLCRAQRKLLRGWRICLKSSRSSKIISSKSYKARR